LLAVNRVYYFGFKWLDVILEQCQVAPRDFLARFRDVSQQADLAAAIRLGELVEESYDLVEAKVPGVDVNWLRSVFRWERPSWGHDGPPVHPNSVDTR